MAKAQFCENGSRSLALPPVPLTKKKRGQHPQGPIARKAKVYTSPGWAARRFGLCLWPLRVVIGVACWHGNSCFGRCRTGGQRNSNVLSMICQSVFFQSCIVHTTMLNNLRNEQIYIILPITGHFRLFRPDFTQTTLSASAAVLCGEEDGSTHDCEVSVYMQ